MGLKKCKTSVTLSCQPSDLLIGRSQVYFNFTMKVTHEKLTLTCEVVIGMIAVLCDFITPVYSIFNQWSGYPLQITNTL